MPWRCIQNKWSKQDNLQGRNCSQSHLQVSIHWPFLSGILLAVIALCCGLPLRFCVIETDIILITDLLCLVVKESEFLYLGNCKKTGDQKSGVALSVHALSHSNSCIQAVLYTIHGANQEIILIISESIPDAWLTSQENKGEKKEWLACGAPWPAENF